MTRKRARTVRNEITRLRRVAPTPLVAARQRLRDFAAFVEKQDPDVLAAAVTQIDDTLHRCARIQGFFRRYVAALKSRVVH